MTWTCQQCGLVFTSFDRAERHARAEHHGTRIAVDVERRERRP